MSKNKNGGRVCLSGLLIALTLTACGQSAVSSAPSPTAAPSREPIPTVQTSPEVTPTPDTQAPEILGARDLEVEVGGSISYREGVTVRDNVDSSVRLQIDAAAVNLQEEGLYHVVYSATDSSGNKAEVTVMVSVTEGEGSNEEPGQTEPPLPPLPEVITQEMVDEKADEILARIITEGMTQREQAWAVYRYVHDHIKYVGSSDKSDWLRGAYSGFAYGRGDCYNYFACAKALLTRLEIPNVDLERIPSSSRHYWQLVNVGEGWYHFDACWHPKSCPMESFLITEAEARAYTERVSAVRENYYVYDYEACPVEVAGMPEEKAPEQPAEGEPSPEPEITPPPAESGAPLPEPAPEGTSEPGSVPVTEDPAEGEAPVQPSGEPTDGQMQPPTESGDSAAEQEPPTPEPPVETPGEEKGPAPEKNGETAAEGEV